MTKYNSLKDFLVQNSPTIDFEFDDGSILNPNKFPLCGIRVKGAILFADLPGYSSLAKRFSPEECTFLTNHFFAWLEKFAISNWGGIVDKFIGDEIMIVFASEFSAMQPIESALRTAKAILEYDAFAFEPKIGIAIGDFLIAKVGTQQKFDVSAIGHVVNLAARCVGKAESKLIKVAISDRQLVNELFADNKWEIEGPKFEEFKNVGEIEVVSIRKTSFRILNFDYYESIKDAVKQAISANIKN